MWGKYAAAMGTLFALGWLQAGSAADTVRLDGKEGNTQTLGFSGNVYTELVRGGGHGGGHWGGGHWGGGHWGGGHWGGGYRGWGYGGYRGWGGYGRYAWGGGWGRGFYRPWYGGYGFYRPYGYWPFFGYAGYGGYGYGYPYYGGYGYGYPSYYGGYGGYPYGGGYGGYPYVGGYGYYGCNSLPATTTYLNGNANYPPVPGQGVPLYEGTFPYDGGQPAVPAPMPRSNEAPTADPPARPTLPLKGKLVSLPDSGNYRFLAYGETSQPSPTTPTATRPVSSRRVSGFAYPAYGEQIIPTTFASDRNLVSKK